MKIGEPEIHYEVWMLRDDTIEILSNGPLAEMDLKELAYAITDGDCSGVVDYGKPKILTKREMAKALLAQGSDPQFLLDEEEGWIYALDNGDEVKWNDPDDGLCSRTLKIRTIEFPTDETFKIETVEGDVLELTIDIALRLIVEVGGARVSALPAGE